jgi:hypothetical protein
MRCKKYTTYVLSSLLFIMHSQNLSNHTRHDTFLYGLTIAAILIGIAMWSLAKKLNIAVPLHGLQYVMPIIMPLFFIALMVKMRTYATTLQDRIIHQEVAFRYYIATQKTLPTSISPSQMIGLRFAGDDEFVSLVEQTAAHPEWTGKEIKKLVKNWKADNKRV